MHHPSRTILHLDMDAFYAAVEIRENPELRGKSLIIGHPGRRGVVSTCSYEAREFGVRSAMPSVRAQKLCPDAIWLHGRMGLYSEVSRGIRRIMARFSPVVEPLSIDEAFIDLTGITPDFAAAADRARELKQRIVDEQRLTASVGVAPNKFLAKIASDLDKPDGLVVLSHEEIPRLLWPLPVDRLWGVGPRTAERLGQAGIHTVRQLHDTPAPELAACVGARAAAHLHALSRGEDDRRVKPHHRAKSISEERTYSEDLTDADDIDRALLARAVGVARQLRRSGLTGRTVRIKVRTGDFTTFTRAETLQEPTDLAEPLIDAARRLIRNKVRLGGRGVRLLGLGVSGLEPTGTGQAALFEDAQAERAHRAERAADSVRDKLGDQAVTRARLIRRRSRTGIDDGPPEASSLPSVD